MEEAVRYEMREGFAVVTLDAPGEKVNVLNAGFLRSLEATARRLASESGIRGAVVISAKPGGFIAGADIEAIAAVEEPGAGAAVAREGQRILDLWAALPFPVVAALHGHCLGGGAEFALACRLRLASPDASIAFPEVRLGIIPGFGGTQRLPRLVGIAPALGMILTGRTVRAREALRMGLVDRIAEGNLLDEALALARDASLAPSAAEKRRRGRRGWKNLLLEGNPLGRALLFAQIQRQTLAKTQGNYPAPLKAIEVVRRGLSLPLPEALALEAREIGPLLASETCKNLVHVFRLSQRAKKIEPGTEPLPLGRAAVLGAGVMGGGIARLLAAHDLPVVLKDIRPKAVEEAIAAARDALRREAAKREAEVAEAVRRSSLITGTTDYRDFGEVDVAIEAVAEKMAVKQAVLREAEERLPARAIFATNTSALSVTELQGAALHPERVAGLHFFNPVERMPLVEVVRGEKTGEVAVATLLHLALRLGKIPIVVGDRPGFLVNRLLMTYLNEAALLAEEGVDWISLDRLAKEFGWPMGPFRLMDEVGIDIAAEVGATLGSALPHLKAGGLLPRAAAAGLRGKKGGTGFYRYREGHSAGANPGIEGMLGLSRRRKAGERDLRRMLYLMINEAARCLEEKVVALPQDIDAGMVFGAGFPPFRGGPCRWADREGLPAIRKSLREMADAWGERFEPCPALTGRESFYGARS